MLSLAGDPRSPTRFDEVSGLLDEVRDLLLADGQTGRLLDLASAVATLEGIDEDLVHSALRRFVDARALGRILHSAARADGVLPPELGQLLDLVPGNHLESLLKAMAKHRATGSRALAMRLVEREVSRNPSQVAEVVGSVDPEIGASLLNGLASLAPELAIQAIDQVIALDIPEYQLVILRVLNEVSKDLLEPAHLIEWLRSPVENTGADHSAYRADGKRRALSKLEATPRTIEAISERKPSRWGRPWRMWRPIELWKSWGDSCDHARCSVGCGARR